MSEQEKRNAERTLYDLRAEEKRLSGELKKVRSIIKAILKEAEP